MDGATFDVGADFDITATATDDVAVASVDLYVNGAFQQSDSGEPYSWGVTNIPAGTYEIYVVAKDLAGNETMSDVVTIGVGEAPPTTTSGSGGDSGGDSGG
ncbi:MAG: serine protease, partial [Deltaproteobacteria bacterium]